MSTSPVQRESYDVIVVGARCAGAATAMLLASEGLQVLAIDGGRYGTDTLSTHALMRCGVLQLHRWGILDAVRSAGTPTVRTTSFHYGDEVAEVEIQPRDGVDGLYAPRRTLIDKLLVDAARQSGAEVVYGAKLIELLRSDDGRVSGIVLKNPEGGVFQARAGLVIGADGMRSTVASLVGAEPYATARHTTAVVFSYWSDTELAGYHWYYRPGVSAGAIATNDGLTCVFAAVPPKRFREEIRLDVAAGYRRVLEECGANLAAAIDGGHRAEKYRGFPGRVGYFRQSWGPGWALVGDAGYFKDPLTAHGMTDALIDAEFLARAVVKGSDRDLADYQRTRDNRARALFEATDAIASFDWDLTTVQDLHLSLSKATKHETAQLLELHRTPWARGTR
jgi:flavin-dependent dehydrogenase